MTKTAVRERTGVGRNGASPTAAMVATTASPAAPPIPEIPDFATKKRALRWLEQRAREIHVDGKVMSRIQRMGTCDDQVDQRIEALCGLVGIPRRELDI